MKTSKYGNKLLDFMFSSKVQIVCYMVFVICVLLLMINYFTNGEFLKI